MQRWTQRSIILCGLAALTITLAPIGASIYLARLAESRLDAISERIGFLGVCSMALGPDQRTTTVPCPRTGLDVEVVTNRRDGESDADLIERHLSGVETTQAACKVATPPK